jgi:large subunit ribosomal protein L25
MICNVSAPSALKSEEDEEEGAEEAAEVPTVGEEEAAETEGGEE